MELLVRVVEEYSKALVEGVIDWALLVQVALALESELVEEQLEQMLVAPPGAGAAATGGGCVGCTGAGGGGGVGTSAGATGSVFAAGGTVG